LPAVDSDHSPHFCASRVLPVKVRLQALTRPKHKGRAHCALFATRELEAAVKAVIEEAWRSREFAVKEESDRAG
jgi:hypothetical protein